MKKRRILGIGFIALLAPVVCHAAPIPTRPLYTNKTHFRIPFQSNPTELQRLGTREIQLFMSVDQGSQWQKVASVMPSVGRFDFQAPGDGEYWFGVRSLGSQDMATSDTSNINPELVVVVDTTPPTFQLTLQESGPGKVLLAWNATDLSLDPMTLQLEYVQPGLSDWQPVSVAPQANGQTSWSVPNGGLVAVRGTISDRALNASRAQSQVQVSSADQAVPEPTAPVLRRPIASSQQPPTEETGPSMPSASPSLMGEAPPPPEVPNSPLASNESRYSAFPTSPRVQTSTPPVASAWPAPAASAPSITARGSSMADQKPTAFDRKPRNSFVADEHVYENPIDPYSPSAARPPVAVSGRIRPVNSRNFQIGYRIDDVGPSGVGRVDLYITQDNGQKWWKYGEDVDRQSPFSVQVPGDGVYGFALRAHSGVGLAEEPPAVGEQPSIVVVVDQTAPNVQLMPIQQGHGALFNQIVIRWSVTDEHPAEKPISLSYSANPTGPWEPISGWQADTGSYSWSVGPGVPSRLYIRLVARDAAGNVTHAETPRPLLVDLTKPSARIVGVKSLDASNSSY